MPRANAPHPAARSAPRRAVCARPSSARPRVDDLADATRGVIERDHLGIRRAAELQLRDILLEVSLAHGDAERDAEKIRIRDLHPGALVAVVVQDLDAASLELRDEGL